MECSICGKDCWVASSTGTCSDCLQTIIANSTPDDEDEGDEEENDQPWDEDIVTSDYVTFHRFGMNKVAFVVPVDHDWKPYAKVYMDQEKYWPDAWLQEERGGYTKISLEDS